MLYILARELSKYWGPARLLQSYAVLIITGLYAGFVITRSVLPRTFPLLPRDRGREFTATASLAKGKPTGAGVVFIAIFAVIAFLFVPASPLSAVLVTLTVLTMLTGFFDDKSSKGWGEYRKALLDLILCLLASVFLAFYLVKTSGGISFWFPILRSEVTVPLWVFLVVSTLLLWTSINTTNCTDGVDGLSGTLVLVALLTLGTVFYFILGHKMIASYLLVPHKASGANMAVLCFSLAGCLMGYLWHNAYPSRCLMGDAGSRALGFFIGCMVVISGNPFLLVATQAIMLVNGGVGLLKVALMRFCCVKIFSNITFPLHDHFRKVRHWSATQVLLKFLIMQLLITLAMVGVIFKVR